MKGKQIVALIVAAVVFVTVGAANVLVQLEAEKERATFELDSGYEEYVETMFTAFGGEEMDYKSQMPYEPFVAVIPVEGTIQDTGSDKYISSRTGYDHQGTLEYIDALMENEDNRAILLYEETPGGTIIDADELYLKLMDYKKTTGRPVYAYMHSYAYSGGYYIAMAADSIYANRNATTGSIGVIMSTYDLNGLYEKLGIKPINITSGENKAMFSGDEQQTQEQIKIYQDIVDEGYDQFLSIVEQGRGMTEEQIKPYADGSVFSAQRAKELGLIDEVVNTYDDAQKQIAGKVGNQEILFSNMPVPHGNLLKSLFLKAKELIPKSDSQVLEELTKLEDKGLMYYAEP